MQANVFDVICALLLIVGGITWGVLGVMELNVVELALEPVFQPAAAEIVVRAIYVLVGLAGLYFLYPLSRMLNDFRRTPESNEL